jgi:hypothetical protein
MPTAKSTTHARRPRLQRPKPPPRNEPPRDELNVDSIRFLAERMAAVLPVLQDFNNELAHPTPGELEERWHLREVLMNALASDVEWLLELVSEQDAS